MIDIIKKLYPINRVLVGDEEDGAIDIISEFIPLGLIKIPSGTKCFTWKIPDKWEVSAATLVDEVTGRLVADYKNNPLHLFVGSLPFEGIVTFTELDKHLRHKCFFSKNKNAIPYVFPYYNLDWGFCLSENQYKKLNRKHRYKVSIKVAYKKGYLTIGESVIKGKTKKEILVIAHVDHPYQANDNLSAVAVAIKVAQEIKSKKTNHTIRFLFLPETIGSIAYVARRIKNLKNIKAVLVIDILGNKNRILVQKTFDGKHPLNYACESSCRNLKLKHEILEFRELTGSDELIFNDPKINIPAVMITTWPYEEYHTHLDNPSIISKEALENGRRLILKIIRNFDRDFVPRREWVGPLMRGKIDWFLDKRPEDWQLELFGYMIDGKRSVVEIAQELKMDVELALNFAEDLKKRKLLK